MSREEHIQVIREAAIAANPDNRFYCGHTDCDIIDCTQSGEGHDGDPIRLADVLLAMPKTTYLKTLGDMVRLSSDANSAALNLTYWNLRADDLTQQSDETVEFISSLLKA